MYLSETQDIIDFTDYLKHTYFGWSELNLQFDRIYIYNLRLESKEAYIDLWVVLKELGVDLGVIDTNTIISSYAQLTTFEGCPHIPKIEASSTASRWIINKDDIIYKPTIGQVFLTNLIWNLTL